MVRNPLLAAAACLMLVGCATTYDGRTMQQLADNYYSCILMEASRDNGTVTEERVQAAFPKCWKEKGLYARVLVIDQGIPEQSADFNVAHFMIQDLENQTIATMREDGVIK